MPILVQVTRGLLSPSGEREIVPRIGRALLDAHGLSDNPFMRENVVGHLVVSEPAATFVAGEPKSLAVVEVKVPGVAFRDRQVQERFVAAATDAIDELKAGDHPRSRTYVNVSYAVDGTWGIAGKAYSNDQLGAATMQASAPTD
jgi:phenylpyruvate tautomerase PptA (4-oxalocrotonate tautomerase family)